MTQIINHCRVLSGWTPYGEVELASILPTWMDALQEVPDQLLKASVDRATADHDWSKPFPVKLVVNAYKSLLIEDRERRERAAYAEQHRTDGTVSCRYCDGLGYATIATYCASWNDWRPVAYPCQCEATPINQRRPVHVGYDWERDHNGRWVPPSADRSPLCQCLYCKNERSRNNG